MSTGDRDLLDLFAGYVTADGFEVTAIVRRIEALNLEQAVSGEGFGEILRGLMPAGPVLAPEPFPDAAGMLLADQELRRALEEWRRDERA